MDSVGYINSDAMKDFFIKLCVVSKRYSDKHLAADNLDKHLSKLDSKKISRKEIGELKNKIKKVLSVERKILRGGNFESSREHDLLKKISRLEKSLASMKIERDNAVVKNNKRIEDLSLALSSIRGKLNRMVEEKLKREKKFDY